MKNLLGYEPLESYFLHRLWWRCSVIRQTTGETGERAVKVVNAPCIFGNFQSSIAQTEQYLLPQPANYHIVIPASYINPETKEVVRLMWGPDGDIYEGDTLFVYGLPFLLQVREIRNPLTLFSHFELNCTVRAGYYFRHFSDFHFPPTTYTYVEPVGDIYDITMRVLQELESYQ